jgi:hypothetical protein
MDVAAGRSGRGACSASRPRRSVLVGHVARPGIDEARLRAGAVAERALRWNLPLPPILAAPKLLVGAPWRRSFISAPLREAPAPAPTVPLGGDLAVKARPVRRCRSSPRHQPLTSPSIDAARIESCCRGPPPD